MKNRSTRVARRARQRARARRDAWKLTAVIGTVLLVWLIWPVKSLLGYGPKWYVEFFLGI